MPILSSRWDTARSKQCYADVMPLQTNQPVDGIPLPATGSGPDEWRQSIRHLETLRLLNQEIPQTHHELGLLHYHSGDKVRALGHFQIAAAMLPDDEQIATN